MILCFVHEMWHSLHSLDAQEQALLEETNDFCDVPLLNPQNWLLPA